MPHHEPTIASILQTLAAQFDGPVAERYILERVLEQRPSTAKNPYATIRERLRWDGPALGWLRLDRNELVPIHVVLQGLRFRCIPMPIEVESGFLPLARLHPFVGLRESAPKFQDATGTVLATSKSYSEVRFGGQHAVAMPSFDLRDWYTRTHFAAGDSIIVTIVSTEPLALQLVREPAPEFRVSDVAEQDSELVNTIVERVRRSRLPLTPCDELILPIFARAPWRTAYPGHPWQYLVAHDGRLQIVNDVFLIDRRNGALLRDSGLDVYPFDTNETFVRQQQSEEMQVATEIDVLQHEIHRSRQQDVEAGLWNGQSQRASANQILFDTRSRYFHDVPPDVADVLQNYPADIDSLEDEFDGDDWEDDPLLDDIDDLDFEDFIDHNPDLFEASQRLMAALPPEALERLQTARLEEAEVIIAQHLNDLLVREPSLFVKMDLTPISEQPNNGSDKNNYGEQLFEIFWNDEPERWDSSWDDELDENVDLHIPSVYTRSSELMSQFYDHLVTSGKSLNTARSRTRDLWVYAEFMAHYYNRTLAEGDYATLDECLFFFYPCKVLNPSSRQIREICTSLKQFYGFLKERGDIVDDQFAQALWRRRNQAAQVVELYDRLSREWSSFERLFIRLFEPYSLKI